MRIIKNLQANKLNDSSIHHLKEKEAAEVATQKPVAEKTVIEESVVAAMDDTVKNPGNMKPRRVAMLDLADKEGKKKVRKGIFCLFQH